MRCRMYLAAKVAATTALLAWLTTNVALAEPSNNKAEQVQQISLYHSNGSTTDIGLKAVNESLARVGVRVSQVALADGAKEIIKHSENRSLSAEESDNLIQQFYLGRRELLAEIHSAGRQPEMHRGGYLQTSEIDVSPYPKVYDMQALDQETARYLKRKFGKLHVNSSEAGVGIDEVMTIVSGGPYTWFFVLEDNSVGKLRLPAVRSDGKAWRISYPGLVPHGGYFDAPHGLVVAYAHGPRHFVMRYEDTSVRGHETLGDNPWIDFSQDDPVLLESLSTATE